MTPDVVDRDAAWERPPIVNLASARVALGPLRPELAPTYNRWRNDFWAQRTYGSAIRPIGLEETVEATRRQIAASDAHWFTIYRRADWRPIGRTDLFDFQPDHRTARFGIIIGEASLRGQGYGTEATRLMLFYGLRVLGLHLITLDVDGANPGAMRAYERAGFRPAGRFREAVVVDGKRVDLHMMDCLASEFTDPPEVVWGMPEE